MLLTILSGVCLFWWVSIARHRIVGRHCVDARRGHWFVDSDSSLSFGDRRSLQLRSWSDARLASVPSSWCTLHQRRWWLEQWQCGHAIGCTQGGCWLRPCCPSQTCRLCHRQRQTVTALQIPLSVASLSSQWRPHVSAQHSVGERQDTSCTSNWRASVLPPTQLLTMHTRFVDM